MPETCGGGGADPRDGLRDPDVALFARMRWNAPLSADHADLLLDRMSLGAGQAIADLGCGWGELLMNAVARAGPGAAGTGIDLDEPPEVLPGARDEAARRPLDVQFIKADVSAWQETADRVLCVGASHAFGGTAAALRALAGHVPAGGRLLFGDGFWARPPSREAVGLGHPRAAEIRDWIDARERQYVTVYREVLGFAYLVLAH